LQLVRIYLDELSGRVVCSNRLTKFLSSRGEGYAVGQSVKIIVASMGPERIGVIIDNLVRGALFKDEWHGELAVGDVRTAYIKAIRAEDGKVAISLRPQGFAAVVGEAEKLLQLISTSGGSLPLSDKSTPEEIQRTLGLSKGSFKRLIGG